MMSSDVDADAVLRAEWCNRVALSCHMGLSPLCDKCKTYSSDCECAFQQWKVNVKQRALNEDVKCYNCGVAHSSNIRCELVLRTPPAVNLTELHRIHREALAKHKAAAVQALEKVIRRNVADAWSQFRVFRSDLSDYLPGDLKFQQVVDAFLEQNPTLRPCCSWDEQNKDCLRVNLIQ